MNIACQTIADYTDAQCHSSLWEIAEHLWCYMSGRIVAYYPLKSAFCLLSWIGIKEASCWTLRYDASYMIFITLAWGMTIRQRFGSVHLEMQRLTPFPSQKPNSLFKQSCLNMSFNKNSSSASTSNNKFTILVKQFNRECQNSDPLLARTTPAPPAHTLVWPKSPRALAQSTSKKETNSKPVSTTTVRPLKVINKSKPGSYAHATARGVSPGSTTMPRSWSKSLHPVWDPACPHIEEWHKVEKDDFVFVKNHLGSSFCAIYKAHNKYILFGKGDTLITKYQNPQREKVNKWLSDLNESNLSLSPPDIIEISNHRGE